MRFATAKDLIDEARSLHEGLARYYERLAGNAKQERVKLLLDYLARHEANQSAVLARFAADSAKSIRDAWFGFELDGEFLKCIPPARPVDELSFDEVIDLAIALDDCIIDLYQLIALESQLPEAREAFRNLVSLERQEKQKMVRQALQLNDL